MAAAGESEFELNDNIMIRVHSDYEALSLSAARLIVELANQAVSQHGSFSLALAGGNSPRRLYELLSATPYREGMPWESMHVFWGDERCVAVDDPRRNERMARQLLLDRVPLLPVQIHPISALLAAEQAAAQYELELRSFFDGHTPGLDLILLGMGEDGHTASLFPHSPVLREADRWVTAVHLNDSQPDRVTLTAPFINLAGRVVLFVSGAEKAPALQKVLEGPYRPDDYPAQLIHPLIPPIWLIDKAASQKLTTQSDIELPD